MKKATFQRLLQENKNSVFSYAFYSLRSREDAEDVTQEVFLKLWSHGNGDLDWVSAWIMKVTHNLCIDMIRKRKRKAMETSGEENQLFQRLPAKSTHAEDPELHCNWTQAQKTLLEALNSLPEKTRSMMLLRYFQGLSYHEIGCILDANINTVKVTVHRGRKSLKGMLAESFPERARVACNE